jgi:beta-N-acetylhexosaminidase
MSARAFIAGCSGLALTPEEAAFFRDADPFGFILFRRNIADPVQVAALTAALRASVGRDDATLPAPPMAGSRPTIRSGAGRSHGGARA